MTQPKTLATAVNQLRRAVDNLLATPIPDSDSAVADALGDIQYLENRLGAYRRSLRAETPDASGTRYEIKTTRTAKRSYNVTRIVNDVATAIGTNDTLQALLQLRQSRALEFTVRWTDLKKTFELWDIPLTIVAHEIEDDGTLDGAHVGEVWETKQASVPIKEPRRAD